MAFQEKSAWIMSVTFLVGILSYFSAVASITQDTGVMPHPAEVSFGIYGYILFIIICHIVIASLAPKDADTPTDERERKIFDRASHISADVLGIGVFLALGFYFFNKDGNILFYGVFFSFLFCQLVEHIAQIVLYRRAI
jgi:hypothetical protein